MNQASLCRLTYLLLSLREKFVFSRGKIKLGGDAGLYAQTGKNSVIHENNSQIQKKMITFGRMVANSVMFHIVANTTNVLNPIYTE
ncbi:MAG: hypothetical protein P1U36_00935 [Legionellaceae bacterium]|nr:hypothetical protein [Legionellaceae bacterium]